MDTGRLASTLRRSPAKSLTIEMINVPLLDQVRQCIRLKHMSMKTEESYVYYIREFILYQNKRHPKEMGVEEIRAYLALPYLVC
jgi:hypothetical protein